MFHKGLLFTKHTFSTKTSLLHTHQWSSEYIEHILIRETLNLVNMRCLDLGYIPYNQGLTGSAKLWGPPKFLRKASSRDDTTSQFLIKQISLETSLEELRLLPLSELLIKNCLMHMVPKGQVTVSNVKTIQKAVLLRKPEGDHLRLRSVKEELDELCGASIHDFPQFSHDVEWGSS
ncbi:hypothetical protein FGO68_gene14990 [Halteria grandinella]|uniref:Uncharacterized protein n=1 Tax=Halteria grandinella TaxID=5974 RepID=A0A8J8NH95_HALGN|nr:hypothetical protein FGO68_gene14990 [Halteria grandinella]